MKNDFHSTVGKANLKEKRSMVLAETRSLEETRRRSRRNLDKVRPPQEKDNMG